MKSDPTSNTESEIVSSSNLVDLCKSIGGMIPDGKRVYQVDGIGGEVRYVLSNSPGNAALAVVTVERLTDKELNQAAFQALSEMAKGTK